MTPRSSRHTLPRASLLVAAALLGTASAAQAATVYWDGTTGNWGDLTKWSTDLAGTTDPTAAPLATVSDALIFNATPGAAANSTLYLNGSKGTSAILAVLTFNASGTTTLLGGVAGTPANNDLFIGNVTVNSGSGAVTIGDTAATPTAAVNLKSGSITITNNSASLLTIANGLNSYGSGSTTTITFTGSGNTAARGVIGNGTGSNTVGITKAGAGTLTMSGVNTYTGATNVSAGTLTLSGNRTVNMGGHVAVGNVASTAAVLNLQGNLPMNAQPFFVGGGSATNNTNTTGTVNHTAGTLSFASGNALLIGNNSAAGGVTGVYNLNGGTITTTFANSDTKGVMIGVNNGVVGNLLKATFNLISGTLNNPKGGLQVVRGDGGSSYHNSTYNQTGGTSTNGTLIIGGSVANGSNSIGTFSVTGGTFSAANFTLLAAGNSVTSTMNLGGTAVVTLPAFPTVRGTSSTATLNFDGGTLRPSAASAAYLGGLTNAFVKAGGAKFDTNGFNITVNQALLTDAVSTGGGLTKSGTGILTLSGANTYAGATTVSAGGLQFAQRASLYNANTASWTATNIKVGTGGILALNVGGPGEFTTTDVTTLLTNLGGANGGTAGGFASGSALGVDTTDATDAFTVADNIGNSTGTGGGALGLTKYGTGVLVLSGANTYTGATTLAGGTMAVGSATAFTNKGALVLSGTSTFDLNGYDASFLGNLPAGASTATITDDSARTGTSVLTLNQTTNTNVSFASLVKDGATRAVGLVFSNNNGSLYFTNGNNTFSGGLTLLNYGSGSRLAINATVPAPTVTSGVLVKGPFGVGPITVGQSATDFAGIYVSVANYTIANAIVANTELGTDRVGLFRLDATGLTLTGTLTAGASDFAISTNGTGSATVTGRITGSKGLKLLSHNAGGASLTVTLANDAGTNDYAGDTTVNFNPFAGRSYSLVLGASNQIPNGRGKGNLVINTATTGVGTFRIEGFNETINGLSGNGTVTTSTAGASVLTLGDGDATATFSGAITQTLGTVALTKIGTGTQTLSGANTYTGATTVNAGMLTLNRFTGSLSSSSPLTLGGGTFNMDNTGATGALSQSLGALTFGAGASVVRTTRTAAQNQALTFSSLSARATGATGNFINGGGTNAAANGFVLTGVTANTFIDKGVYYGGNAYAWNDAAGFVRSIAYGTDAGTATSGAATSLTSVAHQQVTGAVSAQNTATFTTLNISGNNNLTLAAAQTLTVDGILKSGNAAGGATISGGSGLQASLDAELVIRADGANDTLTISNNILANGTNALTKSGAGRLTLSGANTYAGPTTIGAGTVQFAKRTALYDATAASWTAANVEVALGGTFALNVGGNGEFTTADVTALLSNLGGANGGAAGGFASGSALGFDTTNATGGFVFADNLGDSSGAGGGALGLTKSGTGTLTVSGTNTYTGVTTIGAGTLAISAEANLGAGTAVSLGGGTLQLTGSTAFATTKRVTLTADSAIDLANTAGGTIGALSGAFKLTKTGAGKLTLGGSVNSLKTLVLSNELDLGNGTLTINNGGGGTIVNTASATISASGTGSLVLASLSTTAGPDIGTANGTTLTISAPITGVSSFESWYATNGNGVIILSGVNTYTGNTFIASGVISVANIGNQGSVVSNLGSGTTISGTGTLRYTGGAATTDRIVNLSGTTAGIALEQEGTGLLVFTSDFTATGNGNKALTLRGSSAGVGEIAGMIVNSTGTTGVTKTGTGTWVLSGANSYTGVTTISGGVLSVAGIGDGGVAGNLGQASNAATNIVLGGGTLRYTGASAATDRAFTLTAGTTSTIEVVTAATDLSMAGVTGTATTGALTKAGAGTLTLTGANTHTGAVTVNAGTLVYRNTYASANHVISGGAVLELNVAIGPLGAATTTFSGAGILRKSGPGTISWSGTGTFSLGSGALIDVQEGTFTAGSGGNEVWTSNLSDLNVASGATFSTVEANVRVNKITGDGTIATGYSSAGYLNLTIGVGNGSGTFDGIIANGSYAGNLVKSGSGTITLTGASTYTGKTTINAGVLSVSTIGNGGVAGGLGQATNAAANLVLGGGTLQYTGATASTNRAFTLTAGTTSTIEVTTAATNLTISGASAATSGALTKTGAGTLTLSGANTYSGNTLMGRAVGTSTGVLRLANSSALGTGKLIINNGNADTGTIELTGGITIANNVDFFGRGSGYTAAIIRNLSGDNVLSGLLTGGINGNSYNFHADAGTLTISNRITSTSTGRVLTLRGAGTINITGLIDNAAGANGTNGINIRTLDAGTYILAGANTYGGGTTVAAGGTLKVGHATALGNSAGAVSVASGAVLDLNGTSMTGTNALTLNGSGIAGAGALINSSTNAGTYAGLVTLGAATSIVAGTGDITLSNEGTIIGAFGLTVGGAKNTTISGIIGTGAGTLTKQGTGTLTLSGANTYTGATSVTGGTLEAAAGALAGTSGISVSGATLTAADYAAAATLTLDATATATISGASLNLSGAVSNEGTSANALNFSASTGTITLTSLSGAGKTRFGRDAVITGGVSAGLVTVVGALNANISGGTTTVGGVATIGTLSGGVVNLNGATSSVGTLTAGTVNLGTTALTVQEGNFSGLLAGVQGSLIKTSAGTLTLSGANTFGGGTTISAGTLVIGQAGSLGSGAVTVASGAILDLANFGVSNVITAAAGATIIGGPTTATVTTTGSQSVDTVLTGTGGLTKSDGGELTLTTPNFFTGGIEATSAGAVISAAYLADGSSSLGASALNDPTKLVLGNGATLEFTGTSATTTSRSFTVAGAASLAVDTNAAPLTFSAASVMALDATDPTPELRLVARNTGVNRFESQLSADDLAAGRGLSSLVINGTGQWVIGGAANRFKGDVRVDVGVGATLGFESGSLGMGSTYTDSDIVVGNGSKLAWSGANTDDISSRLSVPAGATAKLDLGSNNVTFASAPTVGTGASLEKQGTGTLNISAAVSAPTLNVAVSGGRLAVNGTLSNITLASGATLGGSGTIGTATVAAGATIAPGNSPGLLTGTSIVQNGGSVLEWEVQNATSLSGYDRINLTGDLDLRGANPSSRVIFKVVSRLGAGDGNTAGAPLNFGPPDGASSIRTFQFGQVGGVLLNSGQNISDVFAFDLSHFTYSDGSSSNAALWSIDWNSGTGAITLTAVPEPSTYGIGLGALALAAAALRRRRRPALQV